VTISKTYRTDHYIFMIRDKKILITGGSGLLGINWGKILSFSNQITLGLHQREISLPGVNTRKLDYSSPSALLDSIKKIEPDVIVHAAGLTNIEKCEDSPSLARKINVDISVTVCSLCKVLGIPMIHISTDNLFDGTSSMVKEDHPINPVNMYGKTKAEAETRILDLYDDVLIVRTNFYGWGPAYKPSFSDVIINALSNDTELCLFSDVYYTPLYMPILVNTAHEILEKDGRGIFHIVGDQRLSKFDFGIQLARSLGLNSSLIKDGHLKGNVKLANRPLDMSLDNSKARTFMGKQLGNIDIQLSQLIKDRATSQVIEIKNL